MIPDLRKVVDELKTECAARQTKIADIHAEGWFCPEDAAQASGMSRSHVSKMLKASLMYEQKRFSYASGGSTVTSVFYRPKKPEAKRKK